MLVSYKWDKGFIVNILYKLFIERNIYLYDGNIILV